MTKQGTNANEVAQLMFGLPESVQDDLLTQIRAVAAKYDFPAVIGNEVEVTTPESMDYSQMENLIGSAIAMNPAAVSGFDSLFGTIYDLAAEDPHGELMDRMELLRGFLSRSIATA